MLLDVALAHGVSEHECLRGTGLSAAELANAEHTVEARQELAVARNLLAHTGGQPGLGVEAGLRYTLGSAGILGFALLASPTMRDAITVGLRYVALSSAFVRITLEEAATWALVVFDDSEIPPDTRSFLVERDLAAIGQIVPLLLGDRLSWQDVSIELSLDAAHCRTLTGLFPGVAVTPARPRNLLNFPRELLDQALPQADPHTASLCERQCHELLDRRQRRRGTAALVRSLLLGDPANMPSMDAAAHRLRVDPRTLHRHLARERTSYRALTTETRQALATELLAAAGLSVAEVAHRLGYSEVAAFSRAYKRWTGLPPSTHRRAPYGEVEGAVATRDLGR
jgi:AraC-like DNA-binding protein